MRRRSKYGNIKTVVDGITFHSKKEAARYVVLKEEEKNETIHDLQLQVSYRITVLGMLICRYIADFVYIRNTDSSTTIVEDVKSPQTAKNPTYRLKKKLMRAVHGIEILET